MLRKLAWLGLPFLTLALFAADNDSDRLIQEALKPSPLEGNLRRLTDEIGGRVPGTPAMQRAVDWGVDAFRAAGADSVHTENFTLPVSWAEGATEMSVTAIPTRGRDRDQKLSSVPVSQFRVRAVSVAWAPALLPHRHVRVIDVGEGAAEDFSRAGTV